MRIPEVGDKSRLYRHKYGFCQCGCGRRTTPFPNGVYPMYLPKHHEPAAEESSESDRVRAIESRFVDLEKKVHATINDIDTITNEIEAITKLVDDYWNVSTYRKDLALIRLAEVIQRLRRVKRR